MVSGQSRGVTHDELANVRQGLALLKAQAEANRLDAQFVLRQVEKLTELMSRLDSVVESQRKVNHFEALYNVSKTLGTSLDLQVVLNQVMDSIIQLTGAERGFLMLKNDDGGLMVRVARNFDQQTLRDDSFRYSTTVANQVLDSGSPLLTTNATTDPRFAGQASIVAQSLRSIMAAPLRVRGEVIGVAYVDSRVSAGLFRDADLDALTALAAQAAVAIDNALLFAATDEALAQRVEELKQLRRVDLLLSETLDADLAVLHTLEWACRMGGASVGHLALVDGDMLMSNHHYGDGADGAADFLTLYPQSRAVLADGQPLTQPADPARAIPSILLTPIQREHKTIGIIALERYGQPFNAEEQDRVASIAARAAIAIENAQLVDAVRAADRAKSEFVGVVAHDLKAPMTGIGGSADLLLMRGELSDRQRDYIQKIKDSVHRMEMLVNDLADISRIESGQFYMEEDRVPIEYVVQALKDATMPQIQERRHTFIENIAPNLPDLWTDYYRLLQVLTNLVSNAYKYTPNGGSITLTAQPDGERVRFMIADNGIGMSHGDLAKLGTKFWRAGDRHTRTQPGTGLGFAITRALVEQMGSAIEVTSRVGEGSTFAFSVRAFTDGD